MIPAFFESADATMYFRMFADFEKESQRLLKENLVLPAYECALKCSHIFNILDEGSGTRPAWHLRIIALSIPFGRQVQWLGRERGNW